MTARARFRQSDLTRAVKAVIAAGVRPGKVEIDADGRISILTQEAVDREQPNPWDEVTG